jgi:hypothetical protein
MYLPTKPRWPRFYLIGLGGLCSLPTRPKLVCRWLIGLPSKFRLPRMPTKENLHYLVINYLVVLGYVLGNLYYIGLG